MSVLRNTKLQHFGKYDSTSVCVCAWQTKSWVCQYHFLSFILSQHGQVANLSQSPPKAMPHLTCVTRRLHLSQMKWMSESVWDLCKLHQKPSLYLISLCPLHPALHSTTLLLLPRVSAAALMKPWTRRPFRTWFPQTLLICFSAWRGGYSRFMLCCMLWEGEIAESVQRGCVHIIPGEVWTVCG